MVALIFHLLRRQWVEVNKKTLKAIRDSRQVHFVDVENLCGKSDLTEADVAEARSLYFSNVSVRRGDLFVVAASHQNMEAVSYGWPSAQKVFKSGADGAEIQLDLEIASIAISEKFSAVFVGSGDHYLASTVSKLVGEVGFVTVVSLGRCLSGVMLGTGADIVILDSMFGLAA